VSSYDEKVIMSIISSLKKQVYQSALKLNRPASRELAFMREKQWLPAEQVKVIQQQRLEKLLLHAHQHVPYYTRLFDDIGLVQAGKLHIHKFSDLPILDKPTIRANFQALTSDEATQLKAYENRTSGSTGEPLVFLQDLDGVRISGGAVLRLFYEWHGIEIGDKEIKLWGSEADIFHEATFNLETVREWLSGIKTLNAFRMTPERMREYIKTMNSYRPKLLRGYSANLYELALFAEEKKLIIEPQEVLISSAGTLYDSLRQKMESIYGCPVYNHYGSREMHNMAMECPDGRLHLSTFTHVFEVLDDNNIPCPPNVEGDLVVTSLTNYAMPLIRYRIGDRAALSNDLCTCGRGLPLMAKLSGRKVECLLSKEGQIVPGEYFIYLLAVHLDNNPIDKYQVIQDDYEDIRFRLVLRSNRQMEAITQAEIEAKTRLVMGENSRITFEYVDDIPPTASGKYFYTICNIREQP
jgi:phenylacetate-coenzyme A ligase PaaK-like adenylate-forming protein